jgi:hypothetical protein
MEMKDDQPQSSWRYLFRELKKQFDFVGSYLDPKSSDESDPPFLILVSNQKPAAAVNTPHVIFRIKRNRLTTLDADFMSMVEKGIGVARHVIDSPRVTEKKFQGTIHLEPDHVHIS